MNQPRIHQIATAVPTHVYPQHYARDWMAKHTPGEKSGSLIRRVYDHSGIGQRYSVLPDFKAGATPDLFQVDELGQVIDPTTGTRNRLFHQRATPLLVEAAQKVIEQASGFEVDDVTHVITVSCTGFYNPGPDYELIQSLGLPDSTERYNIGFMGCYAAFPALRMAYHFCKSNPDAVVLVVCLELCSLHLQFRDDPDSIIANAIFADGAAAALVSARAPAEGAASLELSMFSSSLAPEGAGDMAWEIGDFGFDIRLSAYVPRIIGANIKQIVESIISKEGYDLSSIAHWAVHPGGRAILDRIEESLELDPSQLMDSRETLRQYGNMSSATVLFVLKRILETPSEKTTPLVAMAFGPGLTIETALMKCVPSSPATQSIDQKIHEKVVAV